MRSGAGIGVDITGGPVIDPTENVLALVDVEKEHANEILNQERRFNDERFKAEQRFQDGMREAQHDKQDSLARLKQDYDKQISDILTVQVKTTSELISTQLEKVTNSLSNQINSATQQQVGLIGTLSERIGRIEEKQWVGAGRSSVSDPATADTLAKINTAIESLGSSRDTSGGGSAQTARLVGFAVGGAGIVAMLIAFATLMVMMFRSQSARVGELTLTMVS